jgi:formyl-CoA transferase
MILGDLGATVIKVEQPGKGDDTRAFGPPYIAGESAYYLGLNRNKHSILVDFGAPEGRERLLNLIRTATVLVENFRPGTLDKWGLGYEALKAINPGLIYCSISGYGQTGPYAQRPGYDFVAQAESGVMAVTGEIDGRCLSSHVRRHVDPGGAARARPYRPRAIYRHLPARSNYVDVEQRGL